MLLFYPEPKAPNQVFSQQFKISLTPLQQILNRLVAIFEKLDEYFFYNFATTFFSSFFSEDYLFESLCFVFCYHTRMSYAYLLPA